MERLIYQFIFNASMPRSGSELLQVILHQNPRIYGSTTSPLLEYQFAARGNYNLAEVKSQDPDLMQKAFIAMCGAMANGYYSELTDRPIVCDKNRGWSHYYEWVDQWYPMPKMICMVRDLRSIIGSMERKYRDNRHRPEGPDNPAALQNMTVEQRAAHWLNSAPVGLALARTLDCFQRGVAKHMLWVRYEDLCADPEAAMRRIYEYVGEPYFEHDFNNLSKEVEEDDSHFGVFGQHTVRPRVEATRQGDWMDMLPNAVAVNVRATAPWYHNAFEY
jgi:sulfotransferase